MAVPDDFPAYRLYHDYRVDILRRRNRIVAAIDNVGLAASEHTLLVDEQSHGLVFYFPYDDVDFSVLEPVPDLTTRCPWKGEARYWRRPGGDQPVAWAYPDPKPEVSQIRDHLAFYQDRVTVSIGVAPVLPVVVDRRPG